VLAKVSGPRVPDQIHTVRRKRRFAVIAVENLVVGHESVVPINVLSH